MLVDRLPTNLRRKLMEQDAQQSHHSHKYSGFMYVAANGETISHSTAEKEIKNNNKFSHLCGFV